VIADHSAMTSSTASIVYSINLEGIQTVLKKQSFSRTNDGTDGTNGTKLVELELYYTLDFTGSSTSFADVTSAPSSGVYNFSNDTIASIPTGWSRTKPANEAGKLSYISTALAVESSSGSNASNTLSWSTPGAAFLGIGVQNFIFKRATSSETPSQTDYPAIPSGWYDNINNVPSGSNPIWISIGTGGIPLLSSGNYTVKTTWQPSFQIQGQDGEDGDDGASTTIVYYLQTGYVAPSTPSTGTSNPPSGWSSTVPTPAVGKSIWSSVGTKAGGSSNWTWSAPEFYLEFDYGFKGKFENTFSAFSLDSTGLAAIGITGGNTGEFLNNLGQFATPPDTNTTYVASDFNITQLGGYSAGAYANASISSGNVTGALGYTPYNSSNPSGYTSNTGTYSLPGGGSSGQFINYLGQFATPPDTNTTYVAGDFNIGALAGSHFNSSGDFDTSTTLGSKVTFDPSNSRIVISD